MASSPLSIILDMITAIITGTLATFQKILFLFSELMGSLGFISSVGGPLGFGLSLFILALVSYMLGKFIFGSAKNLLLLFIFGVFIMYMVLLSALV